MLSDDFRYDTNRLWIRFYQDNDFARWQELFSKMNARQNKWDWTAEPITELCLERYRSKLKRHHKEREQGKCLYFCIEQKESEKLIGMTILNNITENQAELGFQLNNRYWGNGFGAEIAKGTLDIAFNILKLTKVFALVNPSNASSLMIMQDLDFRRLDLNDRGQVQFVKENQTHTLRIPAVDKL